MMHLPHDNRCTFAGHVTRAYAVFHAIGCVRVLVHDADAAPRQRDDESSVAKAIELAPERQTSVRYKPQRINRLSKSHSIIKMLS